MDKSEIIKEIKRLTRKNQDIPPDWGKFKNETNIDKSEWFPQLWLRWGDAIIEAGFEPNEFKKAHSTDFVLKRLVDLIIELGHFPIDGELINKRRSDKTFPNTRAFYNLGNKKDRAQAIIDWGGLNTCENKELVISICQSEIANSPNIENHSPLIESIIYGYVYLIKHGSRNEYKIGKTFNQLRREGEMRLELPEKIKPIHYIETDDPSGIETYWHNRFKSKNMNGEWFKLLPDDIRAFKRWKKIGRTN